MLKTVRIKVTWFIMALVIALTLLFSTPLVSPAHADCIPVNGTQCPTGGGGG